MNVQSGYLYFGQGVPPVPADDFDRQAPRLGSPAQHAQLRARIKAAGFTSVLQSLWVLMGLTQLQIVSMRSLQAHELLQLERRLTMWEERRRAYGVHLSQCPECMALLSESQCPALVDLSPWDPVFRARLVKS